MGNVFITGVKGIIGSVLRAKLAPEFPVTGIDLPDDLAGEIHLTDRLREVETVVHLARERDPPDGRDGRINPKNVSIDVNVFSAVVEAGVRRMIFASSVHADDFRSGASISPLRVPGSYCPATPYGTYKLIGEEIGGALAQRFGFEFVAIRLGGVSADDSVKPGEGRAATWLSHRDLHAAFAACLACEPVRGRSTVFYAVSNNSTGIHDTTNPFGWCPLDDSAAAA